MPFPAKFVLLHPVNAKTRRRIASRILLAVYIPTLLLLSLHVHHQRMAEAIDCYQCAHHQPHAGHITALQDAMHDCLLCQLGGQSFVAAGEESVAVVTPAEACPAAYGLQVQAGVTQCLRLRGPPAV